MSNDLVTIEVDGKPVQARKGAMLIEVTDETGIYVPRFCYHKKLSVAANCRMCLVEVERAPKPLPACATPVVEGMKVFTHSALARDAQKSTMEFLLINPPLDCPICDQGGECELQDLAMGYGSDVSRYTERKRVVRDKNIGPLIRTDMTRCIHCTRCVRFGEEVAGLRELGATGRGEHMEIGTYIEHAVTSELSGNIIDLCPVGALTSKPYRYSARAWELRQRDGIAPHDCVGSNIHLHIKGDRVKRVVPKENEAVNEVWISDRDRYSYEGLYSAERLTEPCVKENGEWKTVDWQSALQAAVTGLTAVVSEAGPQRLGALVSPGATVEEQYLLQKLLRDLGSNNIDHRLRQSDFSDQEAAPVFPWLGQSIAELERLDAALLIGANPRKDQPIINHRLRKASLRGAALMLLNPVDYDLNWDAAFRFIVAPDEMTPILAALARALLLQGKTRPGQSIDHLLSEIDCDERHRAAAERLQAAANGAVLLGNLAAAHPRFSDIRALAGSIAEMAGARFGYLTDGANGSGAWLAGAIPHRGPGGAPVAQPGLHMAEMFSRGQDAFITLGVEADMDSCFGAGARQALAAARCVVCLTAYRSPAMERYADVMLPMGLFAETSGTFVNAPGEWQSFAGAVKPPGESRPAWKVLRVLGNLCQLPGFDYVSSEQVRDELRRKVSGVTPDNAGRWLVPNALSAAGKGKGKAMQCFYETPMYSIDALTRRAPALQATKHDIADGHVRVSGSVAAKLELQTGDKVSVKQNAAAVQLPVIVDPRIADGGIMFQIGHESCSAVDLGGAALSLET